MFFPLNSHVIPMIFPLRSIFILRIFSGYSHFLPMIFPRYSHKTFGAVLKSGYPQPSSISRMRFSLKSTIQRAGGTHFFHVERGRFYLVGGLEHLDYFPINIGLLIIPIDKVIFFREVGIQPPTSSLNACDQGPIRFLSPPGKYRNIKI